MRSYKNLEQAERAFKTFKGPELQIRPIHHHVETRVRAHVFLCMLAYYLTWHLKQAWAPLLFKDEQPPTSSDPIAKATRSTTALRKAQTKHTRTGEPCHSYKSLLSELSTLTRNMIRLQNTDATFQKLTEPTPLQAHALDLAEHTHQHVDTSQTTRSTRKPKHRAKTPTPTHGNFGLVADEQAMVYVRPAMSPSLDRYEPEEIFGCAYGSAHPYPLGPVPESSPPTETLGGPIVAYEESFVASDKYLEGGSSKWFVVVRNLLTGRVLHKIPTGARSAPPSKEDVGVGPALAIVVKSDGAVAWIAENEFQSSSTISYYEMHTLDESGSQILASGTEIDPYSLALAGSTHSTLYWTQGGKPSSAVLNREPR